MILRIARMGADRRRTALKTSQIVGAPSLALHRVDRASVASARGGWRVPGSGRATALVNVAARGGRGHPWVRLTTRPEFVRLAVRHNSEVGALWDRDRHRNTSPVTSSSGACGTSAGSTPRGFAGSLGRGGGWFRSSGRVWVVRLHQPARDAGWRPGAGPGKAGGAFHVKHALALGSRGLLKLPEGRSCRGDSLRGWPEDRRTPGEPRPRHPKAPEPCVSRETPPCPRIPRVRRAGGRADLPGGRVPGQQPSLRREAALWGPSGPVGGSMPGGSASRRRPTGAAGEVAGETLCWPQREAEDAWTSPYAA